MWMSEAPATIASSITRLTRRTTGASKGVMLTHDNIAADAKAGVDATGLTDDDVALAALPLAHGYGMLASATGVYVKSFGVLLKWFEPSQFLEAVVSASSEVVQQSV